MCKPCTAWAATLVMPSPNITGCLDILQWTSYRSHTDGLLYIRWMLFCPWWKSPRSTETEGSSPNWHSTLGLKNFDSSGNTSDLYFRKQSSNTGSDTDYDRLYDGYPPYLLANTGIVPPISRRQLPYISFPAHLSLIIYHLTLCTVSCCQRQ